MNSPIKIALTAFCALFFICAGAQDLPKLKQASNIETGSFPNGIRYYLVTDRTAPGHADYALVQKGIADIGKTRAELDSLGHLNGQKPYRFLSSRGVGYGKDGYAVHGDSFTMFRFEDVPTSDVASSDTTLMMLFDYCALYPAEQAVIISGDIDAASLKGKMSIFSLLVSPREKTPAAPAYVWAPVSDPAVSSTVNHYGTLSAIRVRYAAPRMAVKYMNTVHALVTEMMFAQLDLIMVNRIREVLRIADIPVADVHTIHVDSGSTGGDESFELCVYLSQDKVADATAYIARALSDLDRYGVTVNELRDARRECTLYRSRQAEAESRGNAANVDRCAAAFLYGTHLASADASREFFSAKELSLEKDQELFNKFVSALLSPQESLSLSFETPGKAVETAALLERFQQGWAGAVSYDKPHYRPHAADTVALRKASGKLKIKVNAAEPITGGKMWTFSNGMKVIYKKVATKDIFHYAMLLRGGYASIPDLGDGEGAFVSDVLDYCDVAGKSYEDFNGMLRTNGISMERQVGVSDMRLTGYAPVDKLSLLLRALLSFANDRVVNEAEYGYHARCEQLRLEYSEGSMYGVKAAVDSIMRPGYRYSPYKYGNNAGPQVAGKTEAYLTREFSKVDDGVFVIIGNFDELELQKTLCRYLDGFKTSKAISPRPQAGYDLRSGWSTYTRSAALAEEESLNIAMSTLIPVTAERFYAFKLAQMLIEKRVTAALAEYGLWAEVSEHCELFPAERFSLMVTCRPSSPSGLPASVQPASPVAALDAVRAAIGEAVSGSVSESELKTFKALLQKQLDSEYARPEAVISAVMVRYSDGKDLQSKYKDVIKNLKAAAVKEMLEGLGNGSKVEYLVTDEQ